MSIGSASTAADAALITGLTHLWNFEEASGSTSLDVVGGVTTDGTFVGTGLTRVAGKVGQAMSYGGTGYINVASDVFPDGGNGPTAGFSYALWYRVVDVNGGTLDNSMLMETTGGSSALYLLNEHAGYTSNDVTPGFTGTGGGRELPADNATSKTDFRLVTVTYDPASDTNAKVYLDGSFIGALAGYGSGDITPLLSDTGLNIGANKTGGSFFVGLIDEVAFWNRQLESSEVTELYNGGAGVNLAVASVPEPCTYALGLIGLAGLGLVAWRKRRK
jgi:hypothetical protein